MDARGIKTGFAFLKSTAGYDILMSLIPFSAVDTYLNVFFVGFLNTILVSILGIFFATILGFIFGVMYFSPNWLIRKISVVYVEIFRNIPVLLQVVFWYSAVLLTLPSARQSMSLGESVFLNVRGLYLPKLIGGAGSGFVYSILALTIISVFVLKYWAKKRQDLTGQQFPLLSISIAMIIGLPLLASLVTGLPFTVEYPELKGFGFRGGISIIPELMALVVALSVYTYLKDKQKLLEVLA